MKWWMVVLMGLVAVRPAAAQQTRGGDGRPSDTFDTAAVSKIIDEGTNRSHVMEILSWLTDVCGSRLTASPGYKQAVQWSLSTLKGWGLEAHAENWGPWGRGWSIKRYSAQVTAPIPFPLISYPKAWSPGTDGTMKAEAIYLDAKNDSTLDSYRGKLKGKIVLLDDVRQLKPHFTPEATRQADSTLLQMADADPDRPRRRGRFSMSQDFRRMFQLQNKKLQMCMDEGAEALLSNNRGDDGTVFVQDATFPSDTSIPRDKRPRVYDRKPPEMLPQFVVAAEHYNRIMRVLEKGIPVQLEINLQVNETRDDSVSNVIAEIPGSDLKNEVVMIGAHLDSWHTGTGATDDGTGAAVCMEAMRILKTLGLTPRRTIRIGLWAAEEEGLLGSRAYVTRHFGERRMDSLENPIALKEDAGNFSVYFNDDNGTGKIRGIYLQGQENLRPLFRNWFAPFRTMGAATLTPMNTGSTDHISFANIGLPAFQFIQDEIDYNDRTWHSNMDVYDRAQEADLKQAAVIMAAFAYNAAMRDEKFPRRPQ